ncbi:ABC transporter permease [Gracilibacillus thailandensis]|uniref:FtsX-like permease family protein n=1 Tax=Gracilibacillus thailandensis TaxID=563735 RepID=A0A6N7QYJ5_9BACI|nr:ABC transporter permease [Gracilibacillus thailandensis]MRI65945.1 FtsX-like permease family protein [Gracilibacillus thailandensis]
MRKLNLKLLRDIKKSKGQFLSIVLVIAAGAFFYAGLVTISSDLSEYTDNYFEEHNLADFNVYYSEITKSEISPIKDIEGINNIEGRYTFEASQIFDDYHTSLKIHSIPQNNQINTIAVTSGSTPSSEEEILLDSRYGEAHDYAIGDKITIHTDDGSFDFIISGLGENVEHAFNIEDPSLVLPNHNTYGVAYIHEDRIGEMAGGFYYNELIVDVQEGYEMNHISNAIEEYSQELPYLYLINKERAVSYSAINVTISNNKLMSTVAPLILFMVAAVIIFLTMSRLIDSQRNQIGIMKALGVKDSKILLHYMGYPVLIGVTGSILGWLITAVTLVNVLNSVIEQTYSLPNLSLSVSFYTIFPPIIVSIFFGVIACFLSGRSILKERAAQALRPKPPKKMKKILVERIPRFWKKLSYGNKLILRNIFLNKKKALASSVGVIVCVILLITAFGFESSMKTIASQINKVYKYDFRVDYKDGILLETVNLPPDVDKYFEIETIPIELVDFADENNASMVITEKENNLIHFFDNRINNIVLDDTGVLVPKSYADIYDISEGDTIKVKLLGSEQQGQHININVAKISTQYTNPSFYSTPEYIKSLGVDYNPSSLLVHLNNNANIDSVQHHFEQDSSVDRISDKSDIEKSVDNIIEQNNPVFIIFILCAILLSFGAIFTISSINIYERTRELATLKVIGYQKNNINRIIFVENIILTSIAVIIALPISGYVYRVVVQALSSSNQQIPDTLSFVSIGLAILLTFVLTFISNLLLRRKIMKIDMIESLKSVE